MLIYQQSNHAAIIVTSLSCLTRLLYTDMQLYYNSAHCHVQIGGLAGVTTFLGPKILITGGKPKIPKQIPAYVITYF